MFNTKLITKREAIKLYNLDINVDIVLNIIKDIDKCLKITNINTFIDNMDLNDVKIEIGLTKKCSSKDYKYKITDGFIDVFFMKSILTAVNKNLNSIMKFKRMLIESSDYLTMKKFRKDGEELKTLYLKIDNSINKIDKLIDLIIKGYNKNEEINIYTKAINLLDDEVLNIYNKIEGKTKIKKLFNLIIDEPVLLFNKKIEIGNYLWRVKCKEINSLLDILKDESELIEVQKMEIRKIEIKHINDLIEKQKMSFVITLRNTNNPTDRNCVVSEFMDDDSILLERKQGYEGRFMYFESEKEAVEFKNKLTQHYYKKITKQETIIL